jgi:hypothetical protein
MNDRFKQPNNKPKRKQKLPVGKDAKCALAYSLLVEDMMSDGIPPEVADIMATNVVMTILEATEEATRAAELRYSIYSTIYNN